MIFFLLFAIPPAFAQENENPPDSLNAPSVTETLDQGQLQQAPSPSAAALGKFGEIPVSHYTGVPSISIPIFTVQGLTLSLPISLDYHASGIRVEDRASWVGLGWALNAGGVITRGVRGLADDENHRHSNPPGYYTQGALLDAGAWVDAQEADRAARGQVDFDPDIFYYNFAGRSGQFIIPHEASGDPIRTIPHAALKIVPDFDGFSGIHANLDGELSSFTITTEDGTRYLFDVAELMVFACDGVITFDPAQVPALPPAIGGSTGSECEHPSEPYTVMSWYLSRIESADGLDAITFEYYPARPARYTATSYQYLWGTPGGTPLSQINRRSISVSGHRVRDLKAIHSRRHTVVFERANDPDRLDLPMVYRKQNTTGAFLGHGFIKQEYKLLSIRVMTADGTLLHTWTLDHGYFNDNPALSVDAYYGGSNGPDLWKRLRLNTIQMSGTSPSDTLPAYTFKYKENLSEYIRHTCNYATPACDADQIADTLRFASTGVMITLPPYTFPINLDYEPSDFHYLGYLAATDHWGYFNGAWKNPSIPAPEITAANRETNANDVQAGVLTRITYPTGGKTEFEYEANTYYDPDSSRTYLAGGLRIRKITSSGEHDAPIVKTFEYEDGGESSGRLTGRPVFRSPLLETSDGPNRLLGYLFFGSARLPLGATNGGVVGYGVVTEKQGLNGTHGSIRYEYYTPEDHPNVIVDAKRTKELSNVSIPFLTEADCQNVIALCLKDLGPTHWPFGYRTDYDWARGRQKRETVFDANGLPVRRTRYHYVDEKPNASKRYQGFSAWHVNLTLPVLGGIATYYTDLYWLKYEVISPWTYADRVTITTFDPITHDSTYTETVYNYNDPQYLRLTSQAQTGTGFSDSLKTSYVYASDKYQGMEAQHMLTQLYRSTFEEANKMRARQWTTWSNNDPTGNWYPEAEWLWRGNGLGDISAPPDPGNAETQIMLRYSSFNKGRVATYLDAYGTTNTIRFSPDSVFVDAVCRGTFCSSYTYDAYQRPNTVTDENGNVLTYAYDNLHRLQHVYNPDNLLVSAYDYAYATPGQVSTDPSYIQATRYTGVNNRHLTSRTYFDGLGQEMQVQATVPGGYVIAHTQYDDLGRPWRQWKPFTLSGGTGAFHTGFADAARSEYGATSNPYVETRYEANPLGRVVSTIPEHLANTPATVTKTYGVNTLNINGLGERSYVYEESTDEEGLRTRMYSDILGNAVRTEAGMGTPDATVTELTYDVQGNLTEVRPPNYFSASNPAWNTTYIYNPLGQRAEKHTPDADAPYYYAYDAAGNVRQMQDPNRNQNGGYIYSYYDNLGRLIETGLCDNGTVTPGALVSPTETCSGQTSEVVTYTYDVDNPVEPPYGSDAGTLANTLTRLVQVVFAEGYYQYSYDKEGRIETMYAVFKDMDVDGQGNPIAASRRIDYAYDLQGNVIKTSYQNGTPDACYQWYEYDEGGRLEAVKTNLVDDSTTAVREAYYTYTSTGQVERLLLGPNQTAIPPITYVYHIRDWLTQINDPHNPAGKQFAMALGYDAPVVAGAPTYANGNIGSVAWRTEGNGGGEILGYRFTYDGLSRLKAASSRTYQQTHWQDLNDFDVSQVVYDPNGNIMGLQRQYGASVLHNLHYGYGTGNRLLSVIGLPGGAPIFAYDANGNMTKNRVSDAGRDMIYDRRNLPVSMPLPDNTTLLFAYDADGQRIYKKLVDENGDVIRATFYIRGADGSVLAVYSSEMQGQPPQLEYWNILAGGAVLGRIEPPSGTN